MLAEAKKAYAPVKQHIDEMDEEMVELKTRISAYRTYRDVHLKWWRFFAYVRLSREIGALQRRADARFKELLA